MESFYGHHPCPENGINKTQDLLKINTQSTRWQTQKPVCVVCMKKKTVLYSNWKENVLISNNRGGQSTWSSF